MKTLENKAALITGGSKGIGYGIAEVLVGEGMNVAITSRHGDEAQKAADKLNSLGPGKAISFECDARSLEAQEEVVEKIMDDFGGLDVLIANAGVGHFGNIRDLTPDEWNETIDINLTGVFNSIKAAIPALTKTKGYIITIASLAGTNFFKEGAAYNASKFGLVGFTQAVMLDLRPDDIKVTTILPGSVATHFNDNEPGPEDSWKIQPEDIGQLCLDLMLIPGRTLPSKIEVRPTRPPSTR